MLADFKLGDKLKRFAVVFALTIGLSAPSLVAVADEPAKTEISVQPAGSIDAGLDVAQNGRQITYEVSKTIGNLSVLNLPSESAVLASNLNTEADDVGAVLATNTAVEVAWDFKTSDAPVQISVDGQSYGSQNPSGQMGIENLAPAQEITVEFSQASTDAVTGLTSFATVNLAVVQPSSSTFSASSAAIASLAATPANATVLRYQTFIPFQWVPVPSLGCNTSLLYTYTGLMYEYGGNNRSYDPTTTNNKTAMQVNVDWVGQTVTVNKSVGDTNIYSTNGITRTLIGHPNAGTSGMQATYGTFYANSLYIHLTHDIANPDCPAANGIYYDVSGQIFRTGGYSLSGQFRQAPNHEFYIRDSNTQRWDYIYRSDINSTKQFACFDPSVSCITTASWTTPNTIWYHP